MNERYVVKLRGPAQRAIREELPEAVATAVIEFIQHALAASPRRVGKPLNEPFEGVYSARRGEFRLLYRINEAKHAVIVESIRHRRDAYRPR